MIGNDHVRFGRGPSGKGPAQSWHLARRPTSRRLRAHGLITRIPGTHRYHITDTGGHHAMLLTHLHTRLLQPGLAQLTDPNPPTPNPLRTAARHYQHALDQLTQKAGLAA